ncbi:hypothetical protein WN55_09093 [Dufourea novaeangliae]|uniref:Uncharacterized protein n=1 Tax=Dufourea novaeangliae TaxID=178035 RepID=A0A154PA18_DUFNO|nr:hypothetical protein WN55_09093 [Dufourea novaeangliae]
MTRGEQRHHPRNEEGSVYVYVCAEGQENRCLADGGWVEEGFGRHGDKQPPGLTELVAGVGRKGWPRASVGQPIVSTALLEGTISMVPFLEKADGKVPFVISDPHAGRESTPMSMRPGTSSFSRGDKCRPTPLPPSRKPRSRVCYLLLQRDPLTGDVLPLGPGRTDKNSTKYQEHHKLNKGITVATPGQNSLRNGRQKPDIVQPGHSPFSNLEISFFSKAVSSTGLFRPANKATSPSDNTPHLEDARPKGSTGQQSRSYRAVKRVEWIFRSFTTFSVFVRSRAWRILSLSLA